jgi:hypothetical protein
MGRARTRKLTKKEMDIWVSGYNKGLEAGLRAMVAGIEMVRKEARVNGKDPKDVAKKFN